MEPNLRRAGVLWMVVVLGGCGQWLTEPTPGCSHLDDPSIVFDGVSTGTVTRLKEGETRSFATTIAPFALRYSFQSCPVAPDLAYLKWAADNGRSSNVRTSAKLASCEACTVLYEERPGSLSSRTTLIGAAQLHSATQRVVFEVTGVAPGRASFEIHGYAASDAQLVDRVASGVLLFEVVAR